MREDQEDQAPAAWQAPRRAIPLSRWRRRSSRQRRRQVASEGTIRAEADDLAPALGREGPLPRLLLRRRHPAAPEPPPRHLELSSFLRIFSCPSCRESAAACGSCAHLAADSWCVGLAMSAAALLSNFACQTTTRDPSSRENTSSLALSALVDLVNVTGVGLLFCRKAK